MGFRPREGAKIGARKIEVEEYLPEVGDWEEQHVVWDFGDGWKIIDDRTEWDVRTMASLTKTCVGDYFSQGLLFPGPSNKEIEEKLREKARAAIERLDTKENRKKFKEYRSMKEPPKPQRSPMKDGESWTTYNNRVYKEEREYHIWLSMSRTFGDYKTFKDYLKAAEDSNYNNLKQSRILKKPLQKLMHLQDPEGRPRCCILMALKTAVEDNKGKKRGAYNCGVSYSASRDLGQKHPIKIDGRLWHVLEVRLGTGKTAPKEALERVIKWYSEATGKWDQKAFEGHEGQRYTGVGTGKMEEVRKKWSHIRTDATPEQKEAAAKRTPEHLLTPF